MSFHFGVNYHFKLWNVPFSECIGRNEWVIEANTICHEDRFSKSSYFLMDVLAKTLRLTFKI